MAPRSAALINLLRKRNGWTLRQMSEKVGIPLSTLAKVEADKLSLTYDKLQQLTARLGMTMTEFLGQAEIVARGLGAGGDGPPQPDDRRQLDPGHDAQLRLRVPVRRPAREAHGADHRADPRARPCRVRRAGAASGRGIHLRARRLDRGAPAVLHDGDAEGRPGHLHRQHHGSRLRREGLRERAGARRVFRRGPRRVDQHRRGTRRLRAGSSRPVAAAGKSDLG